MLKRDIKIHYGKLNEIIYDLEIYMNALKEVQSTVIQLKYEVDNSEGLSVEELSKVFKGVDDEISEVYDEVRDLFDIFDRYNTEMTNIIKPIVISDITRVSRNDIYWNMHDIEIAISDSVLDPNYKMLFNQAYDFVSNAITLEPHQKRNKTKIQNAGSLIKSEKKILDEYIREMWEIYNNKVKVYENLDDEFSSEANKLAHKTSTLLEFLAESTMTNLEDYVTFRFALIKAAAEFVRDIIVLAFGIEITIAFLWFYMVTAPFGKTPKFVTDYLNDQWTTAKMILNDPYLIVEGLSQNASDVVEEKGFAYALGYVAFEVVSEILLTKGVGNLSDLSKAARALEKVDDATDAVKVLEGADDVADTAKVLEGADDVADTAKVITELDDINWTKKFDNWDDMKAGFNRTVTDFLKNNKPMNSPTPSTWFNKGGTLEIIEKTASNGDIYYIFSYSIEMDGVMTTVNYIDGVADFKPFVKELEDIQEIELTGDRKLDESLANKAAGYEETPTDFTWHHDMPCGIMVLVSTSLHQMFTHRGGFSLCK